jgi:hypothetical protein
MAHYIAELMNDASNAPAEEREAAEKRCASGILEMWDHRASLSRRRLPIDPAHIIEVLNRLDPTTTPPIYFHSTWREMELDAKEGTMAEPAKAWLQTAEQIDKAARAAILFSVGKAAEAETDRAKPWIALAEAAGADGAPDIQLIRRLIVMAEEGQPKNIAEISALKDRLALLAEFRRAAETIEAEWQTQLDAAMAIGNPLEEGKMGR